ncbi:hypothetical protein [Sphingomonas sp. UBA978]|uniref:hypothetical protein n=1 Tax=Sphingomonas sp. UBA978 TaxID=1947536 RepID=UPI0025CF2844|nr:hypothetical protein [Sphingomonas sp. UBA978]
MTTGIRNEVLRLAKEGHDPKDFSPGSLETVKVESSGDGPTIVTFRFRPMNPKG